MRKLLLSAMVVCFLTTIFPLSFACAQPPPPPHHPPPPPGPVLVPPPVTDTGWVRVTAPNLNVRLGPERRHPVISRVYRGNILELHGRAPRWLYIKLPSGRFGWIVARHTVRVPHPPPPPKEKCSQGYKWNEQSQRCEPIGGV